jgi:hypothetical protein
VAFPAIYNVFPKKHNIITEPYYYQTLSIINTKCFIIFDDLIIKKINYQGKFDNAFLILFYFLCQSSDCMDTMPRSNKLKVKKLFYSSTP